MILAPNRNQFKYIVVAQRGNITYILVHLHIHIVHQIVAHKSNLTIFLFSQNERKTKSYIYCVLLYWEFDYEEAVCYCHCANNAKRLKVRQAEKQYGRSDRHSQHKYREEQVVI